MLAQRNVSILSIAGLTFVILFHFQNCAPAKPMSVSEKSSPGARLVDEYNKAEIQFVANEVQLREDVSSGEVTGLCSRAHNGATLRWALWATSGEIVARGESRCGAGGFAIRLQNLQPLICGVGYKLAIEGDWGGSASTTFAQRCQPLASENLPVSAGMPYGTECQIEYVPSGESQSPCKQVCYRGNILVSEAPVDAGVCSNLAARLAGP